MNNFAKSAVEEESECPIFDTIIKYGQSKVNQLVKYGAEKIAEDAKKELPPLQTFNVYYDPINKIVFDENEISSTDGLIEYDIKLCFCADWKATAIVKEYYAANSRWPCLCCTVDKNSKNCLNEKGNSRNKEEHNLTVNMNMRENDEHKGYKRKPLIDLPEESI